MSEEAFKIGGIMEVEGETPVTPEVPETPAAEIPAVETPAPEVPVVETPVAETPVVPAVETPVVETPVVAEVPTPVAPVPVVEETVVTPKFDDPEMQEFYEFKQNNKGAGFNDFMESKKDWSKIDDLAVLQNKIKQDNPNVELTESQVNSLIEKEFDIDLAEGYSELEEADQLTLKLAAGKERTELKKSQNTPKETTTPEVTSEPSHAVSDTVTLSNGQVVPKGEYESARTKYKADVQNAVTSLEKQTYKFDVGSGDEKKTLSFDYIVEQDDRQSLLSELDNVPMATLQQHIDDSGTLDVTGLSKAQLMRSEARSQKMIGRLLSLAYAQGQEEVLKQETNVNFDTSKPPLPPQKKKPIISNRDDVITVKMDGF